MQGDELQNGKGTYLVIDNNTDRFAPEYLLRVVLKNPPLGLTVCGKTVISVLKRSLQTHWPVLLRFVQANLSLLE
jgi:hypothetical protein